VAAAEPEDELLVALLLLQAARAIKAQTPAATNGMRLVYHPMFITSGLGRFFLVYCCLADCSDRWMSLQAPQCACSF
jgi:hypothetical protein